ncbi:MAG: hypothetical protein AB7G21_04105 [Dehalococcoidia bacterium]
MTESRRASLARRNHLNVCEALFRYVSDGGPTGIETRHGTAPEDNELVFTVRDWEAFVRALQGDPDARSA